MSILGNSFNKVLSYLLLKYDNFSIFVKFQFNREKRLEKNSQ